MPKITAVEPMNEYRLKVGFNNGNTVILDLSEKVKTTRFCQLIKSDLFLQAKTDCDRVYWNELMELSVTELFELAQKEKTEKNYCNVEEEDEWKV